MVDRIWWNGKARSVLPSEIRNHVHRWQGEMSTSEGVKAFDKKSRLKVYLLYLTTVTCGLVHWLVGDNVTLDILLVLVMGLFSIPYTRVFMHSQMHWGMGGNQFTRFLLDHFISLQFSIPQRGYVYGHREHHKYDNDYNEQGYPRDLQSTFLFSKDGRPSHPCLWLAFYVLVYQHFIHAYLVLKGGKSKDILSYLMELSVIVLMHVVLFVGFNAFYLHAYLPALCVAWTASGIVLYMMHAVDSDTYTVHPTNNSLSPFFNSFGDNDGYHIEHTLFASLHPLYLERLHAMLPVAEEQRLPRHYVVEFFRRKSGTKQSVNYTQK